MIGAQFDDLAAQLRELMTPRPSGRVAVLHVAHDPGCPAIADERRPRPDLCSCEPDYTIEEIP